MKSMTQKVRRLFREFQPNHYIIDLKPNREAMTFSGEVIISGQKTGRPSKRLTFHQNGLTINAAHIVRYDKQGDRPVATSRINHHKSYNEVRLHTDDMLYPGHYTISLSFHGQITRSMNGMYPAVFKQKNKEKKIIATQFESHHAREVFPCIDEPEAKATFDLILTTPPGETVIGNTPIEKQESVKSREPRAESKKTNPALSPFNLSGVEGQPLALIKTTFQTTPKMSTYLLAFVYGELEYKEAKTRQGVVVRTYTTSSNVELTDFALGVAVKCLEFYNDYFGIDYPLPKCDLVALPDFAAGAMENWGCVTFREQALLVDPKHTSLANKQYVAMVVAHELAHQWFGNLVTMRWWTDLWLNEGFASWIEYLAVDHIFPDWQVWTQFVMDEQQQALKLDSLEHTHPIEVPVYHPDEIRTIFDAISYSKGASIIHMLHNYLGTEAFRIGLGYYLKKHAYGNTDTVDLWAALEEASEKPVREFMEAWTTQPGFPIVSLNVNEKSAVVTQERFFTNPKHTVLPPQLWPVPLLADSSSAADVLSAETVELHVKQVNDFKLNKGQSGFYRTTYNASHLERLGQSIHSGRMLPLDRLGLLTDLIESAKAGKADTIEALHFLDNFHAEDNYAVWDAIGSGIGAIRGVMDEEALREVMKPFIRNLVSTQFSRLGWGRKKAESHFDRLLRPTILSLAASADETTVVQKCFDLFKGLHTAEELPSDLRVASQQGKVKRRGIVDPDLRGTVFGTVARLGGRPEFEKLLALHNSAKLSEERVTLAAALIGFKQPKLIDRALKLITTDAVRLQDVAYWIVYAFLNRHAKYQAWEWLQTEWDWLAKNLGTDLSFYRMPIYVGRAFSDESFLKEYKAFFAGVMSPALNRSFKQGVEMIEWQAIWKKRALPEVKAFFQSYNTSGKN